MIVSSLQIWKVNSFEELYIMYKKGLLPERFPENLPYLIEGSVKERIETFLETDKDNLYIVTLDSEGFYLITMIGLYIEKIFNTHIKSYALTFGEDGIWQESKKYNLDEEWDDDSNNGDIIIHPV